MQGVPGGFNIPPPKSNFQANRKLIFYGIVITLVILLALFVIPVRVDYTFQSFHFYVRLEPSFSDEYYVYFPFYIDEYPTRIDVPIEGEGTFELINTQYGVTLNLSGKGPISIDFGSIIFNRSKKDKIYSIEEGDYLGFVTLGNNYSDISLYRTLFNLTITASDTIHI